MTGERGFRKAVESRFPGERSETRDPGGRVLSVMAHGSRLRARPHLSMRASLAGKRQRYRSKLSCESSAKVFAAASYWTSSVLRRIETSARSASV